MKQNDGQSKRSFLVMLGGVAGIVAIIGLLITVLQLWQSLAESNAQGKSQSTLVAISEHQLAAQQTLIALQQNSSSPQQIENIKATIAALENERLFAETTLTPGFVVQTNTIEPTITFSPTVEFFATKTSTPSPNPTETLSPTPTEITLFKTDFQNGYPNWNVVQGNLPTITNGILTPSEIFWFWVGEENWKNYKVSITFSNVSNCNRGWSVIALRAKSKDDSVWVYICQGSVSLRTHRNGGDQSVPNSNIGFDGGTFTVEVSGDYFKYQGKRILIPNYSEGKIFIGIYTGVGVVDIKIIELP